MEAEFAPVSAGGCF